jgi:hypothetical protein
MELDAMARCRAARRTGGKQETLGHRAVSGLDGFKTNIFGNGKRFQKIMEEINTLMPW